MHPIQKMIAQRNQGASIGIFSCCSANEYVLRAAFQHGKENKSMVLVEATANQVDQFGGYTGMKPSDFAAFVNRIAKEEGVDSSAYILGGDHLGPLVWREEEPEQAMSKAEALVRAYIGAGFTKIHLDTSMPLGKESAKEGFDSSVAAERSARLCRVCEDAWKQSGSSVHPVYVIGSEVPIPGGALDEEELTVTSAEDFLSDMEVFEQAYRKRGLSLSDVVGFVVQPGVEFTNETVHMYNRARAAKLMEAGKKFPNLIFEGHSTDYQSRRCLREMVEDGVAILKVGPALTFALREGFYALENIAREMNENDAPAFRKTLMDAMDRAPKYWEKHYTGTKAEIQYQKSFGLSDRSRYYLSEPDVRRSIDALLLWFSDKEIPNALLSQYLPVQMKLVREGGLQKRATDLLLSKVKEVFDEYIDATQIGGRMGFE